MAVSAPAAPLAAISPSLPLGATAGPSMMDALRDAARAALDTAQQDSGDTTQLLSHLRPLATDILWLTSRDLPSAGVAVAGTDDRGRALAHAPAACMQHEDESHVDPSCSGTGSGPPDATAGNHSPSAPTATPAAPVRQADMVTAAPLPHEFDLFGEPLPGAPRTPDTPPQGSSPPLQQPQAGSCASSVDSAAMGSGAAAARSMPSTAEAGIVQRCTEMRTQVLAALGEPVCAGAAASPGVDSAAGDGKAAPPILQRVRTALAPLLAADCSVPSGPCTPAQVAAAAARGGRSEETHAASLQARAATAAAFVCAIMRQTPAPAPRASAPGAPVVRGSHAGTKRGDTGASLLVPLLLELGVPGVTADAVLVDVLMPRAPATVAAAEPGALPSVSGCPPHALARLADLAATTLNPACAAQDEDATCCAAAAVAVLVHGAGGDGGGGLPGGAAWWCAVCAVEQDADQRGGACRVHAHGSARAVCCAAALHCADAAARYGMCVHKSITHEVDAGSGRRIQSGHADGSVQSRAGRAMGAAVRHAWRTLSLCGPQERAMVLEAFVPDVSDGRSEPQGPLPALNAVLRAARQSPKLHGELAGVVNGLTLEVSGVAETLVTTAAEQTARVAATNAAALAPAAVVAGRDAVFAHVWRLAAAQPAHAHRWVAVCRALAAASGDSSAATAATAAWAAGVSAAAAAGRLHTDAARSSAITTAAALCVSPPLVPRHDLVDTAFLPLLEAAAARMSAGPLLTALGCMSEAVSSAGGPAAFVHCVGHTSAVRMLCATARCAASRWSWCGGAGLPLPPEPLHPLTLRAQRDAAALTADLLGALLSRAPPISPAAAPAAAAAALHATADLVHLHHTPLASVLRPLSSHLSTELQRELLRCGSPRDAQQLRQHLADVHSMHSMCTTDAAAPEAPPARCSTAQHSTGAMRAAHVAAIADVIISSALLPATHRGSPQPPRASQSTPSRVHVDATTHSRSAVAQYTAAQRSLQELEALPPMQAAAHMTAVAALVLPEYPSDKPDLLLGALIVLRRVLCGTSSDVHVAAALSMSSHSLAVSGAVALAAAALLALARPGGGLYQCFSTLCAARSAPPADPHQQLAPLPSRPARSHVDFHAAPPLGGPQPWPDAWVGHGDSGTGAAAASAMLRMLCALCVHAAEAGGPQQACGTNDRHPTCGHGAPCGTAGAGASAELCPTGEAACAVHAETERLLRRASVAQQLAGAVDAMSRRLGAAAGRVDVGSARAALLRLLDGMRRDAVCLRAAPAARGVAHAHGSGGVLQEPTKASDRHAVGGGVEQRQHVCMHACITLAERLRALPAAVSGALEGPLDDLVAGWQT